ncbi:20S_proteasome alpha subunit 2 [Hexamita inflata]|uniref:20S proteasome alpha subunit 2 n=1 Tax=Hexamita inflata TaxID=28002 RepID=A0AA86P7M9_9EUKA|nr:20S proteasome alpha subunit 2 [Hexamita inflata]
MQELGYSFSLTTFSPTGQLWQIQHALAATNRGRASIGIQGANGVVLLCQRKTDESSEILVDQSTVKLIENIAPHIGITYSGLQADFRPIIAAARENAVLYRATYKEEIPLRLLAKNLAKLFQEKTQEGGVRPFGCSLLLAGYDIIDDGTTKKIPALYQIDPSGSYFKLKAWANGKNNEQTRQQLEKRTDLRTASIDDVVVAGLGLMRENCDVELGAQDIVVGVLGEDMKFQVLSKQVVEGYFSGVE